MDMPFRETRGQEQEETVMVGGGREGRKILARKF